MSLTTDGSISQYERLIAGTPYWRERKLVTFSSLRKLSFTNALPRRQLLSFCTLVACCNCSGVMIFSFTRRSPSLWDMPRSPIYPAENGGPDDCPARTCACSGEIRGTISGDTNCHLNWVTSKVTLVLVLVLMPLKHGETPQNPYPARTFTGCGALKAMYFRHPA